ncbi:hypothetical protein SDC9_75009 [bioreactor metagenome]|uniref:DUF2229 domain-containing protein n=1 Tax=bioreactor metagenome TaxID=1076179 RepID=A0A644YPR5_9ZZZZ
MKVGVPQGLLYTKYHRFAKTFLEELGAEVVVSPPTGKAILDEGVRCCVDDACLPMKVFHGHVAWLRGRCDMVLLPRIIGLREKEYICPMFCGLVEMVSHSIPGLPPLIDAPLRATDRQSLTRWALEAGSALTTDKRRIRTALSAALERQRDGTHAPETAARAVRVGVLGHAYNVSDSFVNMDLRRKLDELGVGVITQEAVSRADMEAEVSLLFKRPFWTLAQEYYGAAAVMRAKGMADGIIYLSSFSCGIDSVVTELIQHRLGDFPLLILKLDEHTGQAGFDTRLEAFSDMLKRRR